MIQLATLRGDGMQVNEVGENAGLIIRSTRMLTIKLIVGIMLYVSIVGGLLFFPADSLDWWRGWVLVGLVFIGTLVSAVTILPSNPYLLQERLKSPLQEGQPLSDKVLVLLFIFAFFAVIGFMPLDACKFHLMPKPSVFVSSLGLPIFAAGWLIVSLSLRENPFAAMVVKHQEEKKQKVIDTGVYSVVRHPMYAGVPPVLVGMGLWLESYAAAVLAIVPTIVLALRIMFEERFLSRELSGYQDYTRKVRHRLIPFLW